MSDFITVPHMNTNYSEYNLIVPRTGLPTTPPDAWWTIKVHHKAANGEVHWKPCPYCTADLYSPNVINLKMDYYVAGQVIIPFVRCDRCRDEVCPKFNESDDQRVICSFCVDEGSVVSLDESSEESSSDVESESEEAVPIPPYTLYARKSRPSIPTVQYARKSSPAAGVDYNTIPWVTKLPPRPKVCPPAPVPNRKRVMRVPPAELVRQIDFDDEIELAIYQSPAPLRRVAPMRARRTPRRYRDWENFNYY